MPHIEVFNAPAVSVESVLATATWAKPPNVNSIEVIVIGGGGGGGSGGTGTGGTIAVGGGGGGGASVNIQTFQASALPPTVSVTVGAGGAGGVAESGANKAGKVGAAGLESKFGPFLVAAPGLGGEPGKATGVKAVGGAAGATFFKGSKGGECEATGIIVAAQVTETQAQFATQLGTSKIEGRFGATGGGAGGGVIVAGEAIQAGGVGGKNEVTEALGGTAGLTDALPGGAGASTIGFGATGGGGGAAGKVTKGGKGGAGGNFGAGGGGGGAVIGPGTESGAGGKGGEGVVIVISR